jgi:hypothetical protein
MGGGRQQGPSKAQVQAQQNQELAMMQMNQQMNQQQMAMQQSMLQAQIDAADRQRVAAEKAAQEAAIQSQSQMAQQAAQQNLSDVQQKLTGQNTMQELADQNAAKAYNKSITTGAEAMTGDYDFAKSKQNALTQLGAASGTLPQTQSNTLSNIYGLNPAATTAASVNKQTGEQKKNQYLVPNTTGLTFGGS